MTRYGVDCRNTPSVANCTVSIEADSKEELVNAAINHMAAVHGHQDTPEIRKQVEKDLRPVATH